MYKTLDPLFLLKYNHNVFVDNKSAFRDFITERELAMSKIISQKIPLSSLSLYSPDFNANGRLSKDNLAEQRAKDWGILSHYPSVNPTFQGAQNSCVNFRYPTVVPSLELYEDGTFVLYGINKTTGEEKILCKGVLDFSSPWDEESQAQQEIVEAIRAGEKYFTLYGKDADQWVYSFHCEAR